MSIDSRCSENAYSEVKNIFFDEFVVHSANSSEYNSETLQNNAQHVNVSVLKNRANQIDEKMKNIQHEFILVEEMIKAKQQCQYFLEDKEAKGKIIDAHNSLRKHRDMALNAIQWKQLETGLAGFPYKKYVVKLVHSYYVQRKKKFNTFFLCSMVN